MNSALEKDISLRDLKDFHSTLSNHFKASNISIEDPRVFSDNIWLADIIDAIVKKREINCAKKLKSKWDTNLQLIILYSVIMIQPINALFWNICGASWKESLWYIKGVCHKNNAKILVLVFDTEQMISVHMFLNFNKAISFIGGKNLDFLV